MIAGARRWRLGWNGDGLVVASEEGRVRRRRGGRRVLGRLLRDPGRRQEPRRRASGSTSSTSRRSTRSRRRTRTTARRSGAGSCGASWRGASSPTPPCSRRRASSRSSSRTASRRRARRCETASGRSSRTPRGCDTSLGAKKGRRAPAPAALAIPAGSPCRRSSGTPCSSSCRSGSSPRTASLTVGFSDIAYASTIENYTDLWDPLYGEVFLRRSSWPDRDARDAPDRVPVRLLARPLRAAQDAAAAARDRPVLDQLPDPHVRVAGHPRPRLPPRARASASTTSDPLHDHRDLHRRRLHLPAAHGAAAVRGPRADGLVARGRGAGPRRRRCGPSAASRCRSRCRGSSPGRCSCSSP